MATNIEQIFRSFVVTKFREIQEQQYSGGKVGSQQNGEINSSEQTSPSDDVIASIGNLQNDPLVQKIEQVLSEVLGAETQYKPDDGEETAKSKSRSTKRSLSDEVQVEIPRKKSKKDKKHKDKKKKKKRKKEKKYKKQSKESKLNDEHKVSGDIQPVPDSKPENSNSLLSSEDVDIGSTSPLKQASEWFMEKNLYENLNSTMSNSRDAFGSDTSKLDTSEEDSALINIQELSEVQLTNEKELENDQHINLAVHTCIEDESLNIAGAESGVAYMDRDGVASIKEIKHPETSSELKAEEKVTAPENSPESKGLELEDLGTSLQPDIVEVTDLDDVTKSSHPETLQQSVPISVDKTDYTFIKPPLETVVEAKDSVTTLGFLAMVVGKDFEATSEFLNTAKVKASERSPKHDAFIDMTDPEVQDSERTVIIKDLEKNSQIDARAENKLLEDTSESLHVVDENDFEPAVGHKLKHQPKVLKGITESDACKHMEVTLDAEADVRELKETQASAIMMELKDSGKHSDPLETAADAKGSENTVELVIMNMMDSGESLSDPVAEVKNLEATSVLEMDTQCVKAKSDCVPEPENWQTIPDSLRMVDVRNLDSSLEYEGEVQETLLENVVEERGDHEIAKDSETVAKLEASESFLRSGTTAEINDIKAIPETPDILKTQYLEVSKYVGETDIEGEPVNLELENVPESLLIESQYVKETKDVDDVLQSDAVAQRKDSETGLVLEGERDLDATSDSLHMIFTNYSEHSLELYAEPEGMMELKTSESIPELFPIVDADKSEELHIKEIRDIKSVESEAMVKLNDLEKKLKSLHRDVKSLEMPTVKCFKTLVASEAMAERKNNETVSYSVTGIEKTSGAIEYTEKDQNDAESAGFKILPGCQEMTENEPSAKTEGLLLISKSLKDKDVVSSETTPELRSIAAIQELKETVGFTAVLDISSPKETFVLETSSPVDSQEASTSVNVAKDFESVLECRAEQSPEPLQSVKTKGTDVVLDPLYDLEVKYPGTSTEFLFSDESSNLETKQKLKERTETAGSAAAPESLYASQRDLIIVPVSDEANKVVNSEHGPESSYMAKTNSENVLKSLYMIQVKDSKSPLGSEFIDIKDIEMDSESTLREGVEIVGDLPECESVVAPEILEITSESPKKIEMPLESQCTSALQISDAALRSEALPYTNLEANSETICVINIENLEVSPQCEELEVVKTSDVIPTSLFAVELIDAVATPSSVHAIEDKESKVKVKNLNASTDSMDMLEETFAPSCLTDVKDLEASQKSERNLDYLIKEQINNTYTESAHEVDASCSQTFESCIPVVDTHISEVLLTAVDNIDKKNSGTDLKENMQSVVKCSESVCQLDNVSERQDCDTTLSVVLVEIKDSGSSSSMLDTGELKDLKSTRQLETISESPCEFKSRDLADTVEALSAVEPKALGRTVNYSTVLEVQDPVATGTHLNTLEFKSSESVSVLEVTDSEGVLELKTAPAYLGTAEDLQSSGAATETESSEINSETHLKSETTLEVKYFESASGTEYVLEPFRYNAASESEGGLEKVSETATEREDVEDLETVAKSKHAHEIKGMESSPQSLSNVEARDLEESIMFEEVLDVSETTSQFSSTAEVKDLEAVIPSAVAEAVKDSEKQLKLQLHVEEKRSETLECTQISDIMGTYEDGEPSCSIRCPEPTADMKYIVDSNNSEANSGFMVTVDLKDTEAFLKSTYALESVHSKEAKDFEATPKCGSVGEVNVLQVAEMSAGKEGLDPEGISKSTVALERHSSERNLPSVIISEEKAPVSLESSHAVKAKDFEAALEYKNGKDVEVLEQNSKCIHMAEMKNLESTPEHVILTQVKTSEMIPQITLEVKDSEAILEPLCMVEEKDLDGTPQVSLEEQALKATLKPVCAGAEDNLEANQQITTELKDSEATVEPVCMVEKMNLEVGQLVTVEVKGLEASLESVHTAKEKDLEATTQVSLKDQDLQAALQSSDINKQNEGSILKDKKSEKISSKSKDKSKSGKKAKKSRSKSPSKSKKRKKKSRSRSTPRKITSRRGRSRSRNDSDSRKKHSTSRHKSRSKSVDKKDSKESSLRSRRRRSRTSDHPKSRSKSVEKIRSRWRRSRSSDHRKSRSRSIEKRESARRKRRLSRSSDRYKSRSKSVDRRETLTRSRWRRSRSSDHRRSRSQSVDKRETSVRTRRRRSRSSDIHKSRSRSVDKRDTSARRRRRRSRTSDNCKSRSKSLDRRESSIRSRRRWSRSSDHRKSRSRSVDDKRDTSLRTRRKWSRSLDNRKSRSRSVDKETSIRTRRRRSRSSDNLRSRSKSVDKREISLRTRRKRSRSLDNRKSRSKSVDKRESSARARRRRSRSSDNRKSRSRSADKRDASVRTRRKRSRSSDNRKSRSRSLDKGDTSVRTRRRRSRSSGDLKSRSRSVDKRETSVRTRRRRSRSSDNRRSKSRSVDKRETSVKTRRRRSRSFDCKSRSKSPDKRETSVRAKRRRSHSSDNRKSRSKSPDKIETLRSKRKRSRSCDSHKSRSKSVDKTETLIRSKRRRSESSDNKSKAKADEKESSVISRHRRSKSSDRKRSKSKSRSKSSERRKDKEASDCLREKRSKSRSDSPEKTEGTESLEASVCNRTKSPERHKSKSRSKSLDKTRERESSRRSRSKGSKSPEPKSHRNRTVSRSRRNRSRSLTRKRTSRSKSDHRSRTRSRTRSRSCSRRWRRTRSRSVSRQRSLSRDRRRRSRRNRSRSTERRRRRSDSRDSYRVSLRLRSRSRTPARLRCSRSTGRRRSASKSPDHRRSRSSSRSPKRLTDLDKAQLLEIAKANAAAMCAKAGVPLPPSLMPVLAPEKKEEKVIQKSAKETIMELTEKCKKIAQSQEDDVIVNKPHVSDEEEEEHPFINHPFKLNEPKPIFFNLSTPSIKPTPPKNQVTLTKEFPVSSGSQHRKKEADSAYGEWVPVEKNKDENKDDVFPNPANLEPVDISSALNERTLAQKRLTENTFDLEAMCLLNRAQERIDAWAQLNSMPGQFTGSTGAQVLTSEQLSNSGPQAWIKKDQFLRAAPVSGGMGAQLMRKMGWREGEGLGKNKEGNKEPILVDFKIDRKGLVAVGEKTQKRHGLFSAVKDLSGKHPVSALVEACNKRRWSPPVFVLVNDNGPEHRKHFLFKVMVNGVEHKPSNASPNKKHAKAAAATVALQALGIVPKELLANATSFRSASQN